MRISDWSSDVCSSDLLAAFVRTNAAPVKEAVMTASKGLPKRLRHILALEDFEAAARGHLPRPIFGYVSGASETNASLRDNRLARSEERTSELQSLMRTSYAVFCLKKKIETAQTRHN